MQVTFAGTLQPGLLTRFGTSFGRSLPRLAPSLRWGGAPPNAGASGSAARAFEMTSNPMTMTPLDSDYGSASAGVETASIHAPLDHSTLPGGLSTLRNFFHSPRALSLGELVPTSADAQQAPPVVTEISLWYSIACAALTLAPPTFAGLYATSLNRSYITQHIVCSFPISACAAAMLVSQKPRRQDKAYLFFLYLFLISFSVGTEVFIALGDGRATRWDYMWQDLFRIFIVWLPLVYIGLRIRRTIAKLPDELLSKFLCETVLVQGARDFVPILLLTFDSGRCLFRPELSLGVCDKTIAVQMFLGFYLVMFMVMRLLQAAIPRHIARGHQVNMTRIAMGDLDRDQVLSIALGATAGICSIFLAVNAGQAEEAPSDQDMKIVWVVGIIGASCIMVFATFKAWQIRRDIRVERRTQKVLNTLGANTGASNDAMDAVVAKKNDANDPDAFDDFGAATADATADANAPLPFPHRPTSTPSSSTSSDLSTSTSKVGRRRAQLRGSIGVLEVPVENLLVLELSWAYVMIAFVCSLFNPVLIAVYAVTLDSNFVTYGHIAIPITNVLWVLSIMAKPLRKDAKYMTFLYGHFFVYVVIPEIFMAVAVYRLPDQSNWWAGLVRVTVLWFPLFLIGLRFRKSVSKLPLEHISSYLLNNVIRQGIFVIGPLTYLSLASIKCVTIAWPEVDSCSGTASVQVYLSAYIIGFVVLRMAMNGVQAEVQEKMQITLHKLATFSLSAKEIVFCFLLCLTGLCSLFLFSNLDGQNQADEYTLSVIGISGIAAVGFIFVVQCATLLWNRRKIRRAAEAEEKCKRDTANVGFGSRPSSTPPDLKLSLQTESSPTEAQRSHPGHIENLSGVYIAASAMINLILTFISAKYAVTLARQWVVFSRIALPFGVYFYILTLMMRPRNKTRFYLTFLSVQFFVFALGTETLTAIGDYRQPSSANLTFNWYISVVRCCVVWGPGAFIVTQIRKMASKLPDEDLSAFLMETVLKGGMYSLGPLTYLAFAPIKCVLAAEIIDNGYAECEGTATCHLYLSSYCIFSLILTLATKAASKEVRQIHEIHPERMASLKLRKSQAIQAACLVVTGVCALYLLTNIDSINQTSNYVLSCVGITGLTCIAIVTVWRVAVYCLTNNTVLERKKSSLSFESVKGSRGDSNPEASCRRMESESSKCSLSTKTMGREHPGNERPKSVGSSPLSFAPGTDEGNSGIFIS